MGLRRDGVVEEDDRLTFGGNIIETGTVSYRLAHARAHRAGKPIER